MIEAALGIFTSFRLAFSGLALVNIIFIIALIFRGGKFKSRILTLLGLAFCAWVLISVLVASMTNPQLPFGTREVIQIVFSLQYLLLAFKLAIDYERVGVWAAMSAVVFSAVIIIALFVSGSFQGLRWEPYLYYEWGFGVVPGWPNDLSAPLGFALWGILQKKWIQKFLYPSALIVSIALLTTSSRGALLALILIWLYHFWTLRIWSRLPFAMRAALICGLVCFVVMLLLNNLTDSFLQSILRSHDRVDIADVSMQLIAMNPIFGYGGRTLDQIQFSMPIDLTDQTYPQAHNFIFEIALRHGIVGLILFLVFLFVLFKGNLDRDKTFILFVLIVLALTQDYIRDFVYLFCLYWLANSGETVKHGRDTFMRKISDSFRLSKVEGLR